MAAILPILIPLLTALAFLVRTRPTRPRRALAAASAGAQLLVALWLVVLTSSGEVPIVRLGGWMAPFGIVLVADTLAAIMVTLSSLTALACVLYGFAESGVRIEHPLRLPLVQFLVIGINLSFLTGDLFNLFVAFEVMLLASYALLTLEADDWDIRQAYPYLALNIFASALFLAACGLAYGLFGTLNFAQIAERSAGMGSDPMVISLAFLMLAVFGLKAGLFPLYYWLPNSYPILPTALAALYSGMLTKVGVYVLLRMYGTVLPHDLSSVHQAIAWMAGLTMLFGVFGAVARPFIRGILSFHILSQIGFMALAIGFFRLPADSPHGAAFPIAACIFYITHHIIVKSTLFLAGGVVGFLNRSDDLEKTGGLWKVAPWLGLVFLFQAMSLAGIPPLSGFWGKYMIIVAGFELREYTLVAFSIIASILTLFSMLKIWLGAFCNPAPPSGVRIEDRRWVGMTAVGVGLTAVSLVIGLFPAPFMDLAFQAAASVLDQPGYIARVLGGTAP